MREDGWRRSERFEEQDVFRRIGHVIVAANHMADPHVHVVDDDREVVRRVSV